MGTAKFLGNQSHSSGVTPVREVDRNSRFAVTLDTVQPFSVTVASAGTVVTLWAPQERNRFRVGGYTLSVPSAAARVNLYLRAAGVASAGFQWNVGPISQGVLATNPPLLGGLSAPSLNTALVLDSDTAGVVVTGTIFGDELRELP